MQPRTWIMIGAILAGTGVAAGALGAHGLEERLKALGVAEAALPKRLANYETAVRYQMYHAIGIVLAGLVALHRRSPCAQAAGFLFLLGIVLFSGCLYAWVFSGRSVLAIPVPFGGVMMIVGWLVLAIAGWKVERRA